MQPLSAVVWQLLACAKPCCCYTWPPCRYLYLCGSCLAACWLCLCVGWAVCLDSNKRRLLLLLLLLQSTISLQRGPVTQNFRQKGSPLTDSSYSQKTSLNGLYPILSLQYFRTSSTYTLVAHVVRPILVENVHWNTFWHWCNIQTDVRNIGLTCVTYYSSMLPIWLLVWY